jgi:hypothetical protein
MVVIRRLGFREMHWEELRPVYVGWHCAQGNPVLLTASVVSFVCHPLSTGKVIKVMGF